MNQSQQIMEMLGEAGDKFALVIKKASKRGRFRIEVVKNFGDKPVLSQIVVGESEVKILIAKLKKKYEIDFIKNTAGIKT